MTSRRGGCGGNYGRTGPRGEGRTSRRSSTPGPGRAAPPGAWRRQAAGPPGTGVGRSGADSPFEPGIETEELDAAEFVVRPHFARDDGFVEVQVIDP